jgi:hypothetical protein
LESSPTGAEAELFDGMPARREIAARNPEDSKADALSER